MFGIEKTLQLLDGVFAITVFDTEKAQVHIGRDTFGVRPMFTIRPSTGELGVCSEAKGLIGLSNNNGSLVKVNPFLPGTYATFDVCRSSGTTKLVVEKTLYRR